MLKASKEATELTTKNVNTHGDNKYYISLINYLLTFKEITWNDLTESKEGTELKNKRRVNTHETVIVT